MNIDDKPQSALCIFFGHDSHSVASRTCHVVVGGLCIF